MGSYTGCWGEGSRAALLGACNSTRPHVLAPARRPSPAEVADAILEDEAPSHFRPRHGQGSSDAQISPAACWPWAPEDAAVTPRLASPPWQHLQGSVAQPQTRSHRVPRWQHSLRAQLWPPLTAQFTQNSKISCFKFHAGYVSPGSPSRQGPHERDCVHSTLPAEARAPSLADRPMEIQTLHNSWPVSPSPSHPHSPHP